MENSEFKQNKPTEFIGKESADAVLCLHHTYSTSRTLADLGCIRSSEPCIDRHIHRSGDK